ncbi:hypothetical protein CRG98_022112 [Punica granatum]|uniref:Uncharacterized protein n=1 Tax=Punica granatum TaxID=22663 RepID=A0A2I0JMF9_PUNGR|nr:hypothetical protein CRG98_022112 [Punica granatum]
MEVAVEGGAREAVATVAMEWRWRWMGREGQDVVVGGGAREAIPTVAMEGRSGDDNGGGGVEKGKMVIVLSIPNGNCYGGGE